MTIFSELMEAIGNSFGLSIELGSEMFCKINTQGVSIQFEFLEAEGKLAVVSLLGEVSPGTFREDLLFAALKENGKEALLYTFGYAEPQQQLALQFLVPINTSADKIFELLQPFIDKAALWKKALEENNLQSIYVEATPSGPSPFEIMK